MASSRLGIVTGHRAPELSEDGKRVATALEGRGFRVDPVLWTDAGVEWEGYDAALVRSCWDYHADPGRFRDLLAELERAGVTVCNPLRAIRWNLHKSYLADLAAADIAVPGTAVVDEGSDASLTGILRDRGWREAVVKPAVGTSSTDVWRTRAGDPDEDRFRSLVAAGDVVVQSFAPEIRDGERSVVVFDGEYSHAWNSLTAETDVTAFDGHDVDYEPRPAVVEDALDAAGTARRITGVESLPYARVDYVVRDGRPLLMELEVIEPYLGLDRGEGALDDFVAAVADYVRDPPG